MTGLFVTLAVFKAVKIGVSFCWKTTLLEFKAVDIEASAWLGWAIFFVLN